MAIVVEDGTGLANAVSYVSAEDATLYHQARGNLKWEEQGTPEQEAALIRATQYVDGKYHSRWVGYRANGRNQALDWPRLNAYDSGNNFIASDEIPSELEQAISEAALRELVSPNSLLPDFKTSDRITSQTVGPISTDFAVSNSSVVPVTPVIDNLLQGILKDGGYAGVSFIKRA
jgi:hypothetical protein